MKPTINIISTFDRVENKDGADHFTGTLDVAVLRKAKQREVEVVLVPIEAVPPTLLTFMTKNGINKTGLVMFAGTSAQESARTDKRRKGPQE